MPHKAHVDPPLQLTAGDIQCGIHDNALYNVHCIIVKGVNTNLG